MKSKKEATDVAKSICTEQWKTAHDIASVRALNSAFEDCQEGPSYDLGESRIQIIASVMTSHLLHRSHMAACGNFPLVDWFTREVNEAMHIHCGPRYITTVIYRQFSWESIT